MCEGIEIADARGRTRLILFEQPDAALPVLRKDGSIGWVPWGIRNNSELRFPLAMPHAGWIRHSFIQSGNLKRWHPRPVQIVPSRFMVKTSEEDLWVPRRKTSRPSAPWLNPNRKTPCVSM